MRLSPVAIVLVLSLLFQWTGLSMASEWIWCFEVDGSIQIEQTRNGIDECPDEILPVSSVDNKRHLKTHLNQCIDVPIVLATTSPETSKPEYETLSISGIVNVSQVEIQHEFFTLGLLAEPPPYLLSNFSLFSLRTIILII